MVTFLQNVNQRQWKGIILVLFPPPHLDFLCQRWDSQSPHPHNLTDPERFPDVSVEAASNYCRNPDGKPEGPWCFTDDPFVEWEYCDIPACSGL